MLNLFKITLSLLSSDVINEYNDLSHFLCNPHGQSQILLIKSRIGF